MFCPSQLWQYGEHKPLSPSWLYPLVPESHLTQYLDNQQVNWNSGPWGLAQVVKGWSGFVGGSWWKRQKNIPTKKKGKLKLKRNRENKSSMMIDESLRIILDEITWLSRIIIQLYQTSHYKLEKVHTNEVTHCQKLVSKVKNKTWF